jgi:hypothetical protein
LYVPISDDLKDAIRNCGKTVLQIARETGIPQPTLSRFISTDPKKHRDIRVERTADKLAAYFGLELGRNTKGARRARHPRSR